jgi:serine/threonine protein kinase
MGNQPSSSEARHSRSSGELARIQRKLAGQSARSAPRKPKTSSHESLRDQAYRGTGLEAGGTRKPLEAPTPVVISQPGATGTAAGGKPRAERPCCAARDLSQAAYGLNASSPPRKSSMIFGQARVTREDFMPLKTLGRGSFAKVLLVRKRDTGELFAMKILSKKAIMARNQIEHTMAERLILGNVQHPYIVALRYAFQTEDQLYLVLDYCSGGELFFHLKREGRFPESTVRVYIAEITLALEYLHARNIIYRDLKPENVLLDREGHVLLADFGLSKLLQGNQDKAMTYVGTVEYLAPEVITAQGHSFAVDWWAMGTLMAELISGLPPFYSTNVNLMMERILKAELRLPEYVSPEARSLIAGLLTRDPSKRLGSGANGAAAIKRHPFFSGLDWDALMQRKIPAPFQPVRSDAPLDSTENFDTSFTDEAPTFDTSAEEERVRAKLLQKAAHERMQATASLPPANRSATDALNVLDGNLIPWTKTPGKVFEGFTYVPHHGT